MQTPESDHQRWQPAADLEWTQTGDWWTTNYNGTTWLLIPHSSWQGKSGWSETGDWHLHLNHQHGEGRYLAPPRQRRRAQRLASWIIANGDPNLTLGQIIELAEH